VVLDAYKCRAFKLISVSVKYQVLKQIYQERYGYNKTGKKDEPTKKNNRTTRKTQQYYMTSVE
jgi:hypothetical protein